MDERPETEVWYRAPMPYIKEAVELGVKNFCMDRGYMQKRKITNPVAWANLHLGLNTDWRVLEVDHDSAAAYLWESGTREPTGIFPVFSARRDFYNLIEMIEKPEVWKQNDQRLFRVPENQDHVIVVADLPSLQDAGKNPNNPLSPGVRFYQELSELQEEHPEVKIILHGSYSFSKMFGLEFKAVTYDPGNGAGGGQVFLPVGRIMNLKRDLKKAPSARFWYNLLGSTYNELKDDAHARRLYNIKAGLFAGRYYKRLDKFRISRGIQNYLDPELHEYVRTNSLVYSSTLAAQPGDRVVCSDCSLWLGCKYFREGAICVVGNSPMRDVNKLFKTRDADSIVKALSALAATNAERAEAALEEEAKRYNDDDKVGEVDGDLTKLLESTFKMGDRLLQIVDPSTRNGRAAVNVNVGSGAQRVEITQSQPQEQVAHIYSMLERQGYSRDQITPELVSEVLENLTKAQPKIENGKVIQGELA